MLKKNRDKLLLKGINIKLTNEETKIMKANDVKTIDFFLFMFSSAACHLINEVGILISNTSLNICAVISNKASIPYCSIVR